MTKKEDAEKRKVKIRKLILEAIKEHGLVYLEEIPLFVPICRKTVQKNHNVDEVRDALDEQKLLAKQNLRKKWAKSGQAISEIALYKLLGTQDEVERISGNIKQKIDASIDFANKEDIQKEIVELQALIKNIHVDKN